MADGRGHNDWQPDNGDHERVKIHDNVVCDKPTGAEIDNKVNESGPLFLQGTTEQ
jgi:hypothetical protein